MKTRQGFVSNSSSTSFTFCYKGKGVKPLCDLILTKYRSDFSRHFEEWSCNALDVVDAIEACAKSENEYCKVEPIAINKVIASGKASLKQLEEDLEKNKRADWLSDCILERKRNVEDKIRRLEDAKAKGLTTLLIMGFGDHDGNVSGGDLGNVMDYDGRDIAIDANDLVVFTEQNR